MQIQFERCKQAFSLLKALTEHQNRSLFFTFLTLQTSTEYKWYISIWERPVWAELKQLRTLTNRTTACWRPAPLTLPVGGGGGEAGRQGCPRSFSTAWKNVGAPEYQLSRPVSRSSVRKEKGKKEWGRRGGGRKGKKKEKEEEEEQDGKQGRRYT